MRALLLALSFAAAGTAAAQERLPGFVPDLALHAGGYGSGFGYSTVSGRSADLQLLVNAEARERFGAFALDGSLLGLFASSAGTQRLLGGTLRAGYAGSHVRALLGAFLNTAPSAPVQILPSLTVEAGTGEWRGILGVFDQSGLIPARLGVGWRNYTLCYVPALGLDATAAFPITESIQIEARGFAYTLLGAQFASLTAGIRWALPGGAP